MLIKLTNTHALVVSAKDHDRSWLSDYLSFRTKGSRGREEVHSLYNSIGAVFPSGMIEAVQAQAKHDRIRVDVVDTRKAPCAADKFALLDWLRDYQTAAIDVARTKHRGVYHHVTGAGKTEVIVGLTELYDCPWLIIVHRKELLHQTAERFAMRTGELVGKIGDGVLKPGRVTIAMFQTLVSLIKTPKWKRWLESRQGLIVDECHVLPASTFYRVAQACTAAHFRYGFSGTPFARGDRKSVYTWGALGPIIHEVRAPELIDAGVLARPQVRMVPVMQLIHAKTWAEVYRIGIVESPTRNAAVISVARAAAKPCLLFVQHIEHGKTLCKELARLGEQVEFVWGTHKTPIRRAAIRRLVHGDIDILICNVIFQEGVDIPELQSVVVGSGGKSTIMVLQYVGRGMRKRDRNGSVTKEEVEIYDFLDRGNRWLQRHAKARLKAYATEKYPVVIDPGGVHATRAVTRGRAGTNGKEAVRTVGKPDRSFRGR